MLSTKKLHRSFLTLVAACVIPGVAWAEQPPAVVEVANVVEQNASSVIRVPGSVISTRDATVSAEINGRITWVAEVGDRVAAGEPVARIDDHLLNLQLRNNDAEIARIHADINYNERQKQRLEKLAAQNNMAQSELDEVESRLAMLRQDKRIATVNRDRTRYDLARSEVTAPFSGVVVSREVALGEYTGTGESLLRLVDTEALEISVSAPLRVARYASEGQEVQVSAGELQTLQPIRSLVPVGDTQSRMMEVRLSANSGYWMIGEAVTVELPQSPPEVALAVPRDALVLRDNEVFVYTVSADSTAVKVPVATGAGHGSTITIDGALSPGDSVVVRGAETLREGQALRITQHHIAASR